MTLYMCNYDWSSGSLIFKQKQSRFHDDRSIDQSISEKNPEIFGYILDFFLKCQSISAILNKIAPTSYPPHTKSPPH